MSLISWLCFLIVFCKGLSCLRKGVDVFSPARVFGFIWALAVGLADLKLSGYQEIWTLYGWVALLLGIFSFLLGIYAVYCLSIDTPLLSVQEIRHKLREEARTSIDQAKMFRLIIVLFAAYILAYSIEVMLEGTVPLFSRYPERLRVTFGFFGLHLIVDTQLAIMLLIAEYFLFFRNHKIHGLVLGVIFFVTAGTFFAILQRYNFFLWAVITLGMTYYFSNYLRLRTVVLTGGIFFGILSLIQTLRSVRYVESYLYVISRMKYSRTYALFTEPYMYIVTNLENYARAVNKLDDFYFGYFTLDWLMALVGLKHSLAKYFGIERLPFLTSGYNTFPFHWWYYYDFGLVGIAILPFLSGAVIAYIYYKVRTTPSILVTIFYSMAILLMVLSFMMNPLNRLDFVTNVFIVWVAHEYLIKTKPESV